MRLLRKPNIFLIGTLIFRLFIQISYSSYHEYSTNETSIRSHKALGNWKVLVTIFAGRRDRTIYSLDYLHKLHKRGLVHEVHLWDYSRSREDYEWLLSYKPSFLHSTGKLKGDEPHILDGHFTINFNNESRCSHHQPEISFRVSSYNDVRIRFSTASGSEIRLVFVSHINKNGSSFWTHCYNCTSSKVAENQIVGSLRPFPAFTQFQMSFTEEKNVIVVRVGDEDDAPRPLVLSSPFPSKQLKALQRLNTFEMSVDSFWASITFEAAPDHRTSWEIDSICSLRLNPRQKFLKLATPDRLLPYFTAYYNYYAVYSKSLYNNSVLVKVDDDIVYMDINNFVYYIRYRLNNPAVFILFPNIVNNGICAYYQQHVQHVLPRSVGSFERFVGKNWGSLWHDSRKCNALHKYFMQNVSAFSHPDKYLTYDVPDELRVSVNFFAVMPDVVQRFFSDPRVHVEDELVLSVMLPTENGLQKKIFPGFVVAHLSFGSQESSNGRVELLNSYANISNNYNFQPRRIQQQPVLDDDTIQLEGWKVVVTVFAGRQDRTQFLLDYLYTLYKRGQVHEVHLWDYSRAHWDTDWINSLGAAFLHSSSENVGKDADTFKTAYSLNFTEDVLHCRGKLTGDKKGVRPSLALRVSSFHDIRIHITTQRGTLYVLTIPTPTGTTYDASVRASNNSNGNGTITDGIYINSTIRTAIIALKATWTCNATGTLVETEGLSLRPFPAFTQIKFDYLQENVLTVSVNSQQDAPVPPARAAVWPSGNGKNKDKDALLFPTFSFDIDSSWTAVSMLPTADARSSIEIDRICEQYISPSAKFLRIAHPDKTLAPIGFPYWTSYYKYYAAYAGSMYNRTVLVKIDDDIVYLDLENFQSFITYRVNNRIPYLLFPNVINNNIAAYYQQQVQHVLPYSVGSFEMPPGGKEGTLWEDGKKAFKLHEFFLQNRSVFSHPNKRLSYPIADDVRYSINCFAILPEHVSILFNIDRVPFDDEIALSLELPVELGFEKALFPGFTLAHLSYYAQEGWDGKAKHHTKQIDELIEVYKKLSETLNSNQ